MADVINTQLSYLTPQDIHAIVIYLRSLRPVEKQQGAAKISVEELEVAEQSHSHGSHLYSSVCSNCHLENGQGRQGEYESLWGSRTATITGGNNLVKVILEGSNLKDPKLGNYMMPSFKDIFNDQDIADIANYVISRFGGRNGHVTAEQVRKERALLNKE
nr:MULTISPECIES: cytochrome c [unclassified Commensalibacter]